MAPESTESPSPLKAPEIEQGLIPRVVEVKKLDPFEVREQAKMVILPVSEWNGLSNKRKKEIMTRFFAQDLANILSLYGDHRTHPAQKVTMQIDGQKYALVKTPYGSNIKPPSEETIKAIGKDRSASASTGENPTREDMDIMQENLDLLKKALKEKGYKGLCKEFERMKTDITAELRSIYGIPENIKGLFSLSGTEAILWSLLTGVTQYCNNQETGSGSVLAASGLYSSPLVWHGEEKRGKGARIEGFEHVDPALQMPARRGDGKPISPKELLATTKELVEEFPNEVFGVEAVINGKTGEEGLLAKSVYDETVEFIQDNKNTVLVVDAAQTRIKPEMMQKILADERLEGRVLLFFTGSKLPGKYIFSCQTFAGHGAIKMMKDFIKKKGGVPKGMRDFIGRSDLEDILRKEVDKYSFLISTEGKTEEKLPDILNIPAILKWFPALKVMKEFYDHETGFRDRVVSEVCEKIREQIEGKEGQDELKITQGVNTSIHEARKANQPYDQSEETAVIPYQAWIKEEGKRRPLTKKELEIVQWLLTFNVAELADKITGISNDEKIRLRKIFACPCLPGQAVQESPLEELPIEEMIAWHHQKDPSGQDKLKKEIFVRNFGISKPESEPASLRIAPNMDFFNRILKEVEGNFAINNPAVQKIIDGYVAEEITPIINKSRALCQYFTEAKNYYDHLHKKE